MPVDERVSALHFTERAELHGELRVIANAAAMAMVHIDIATATIGELLATYGRLWDRNVAFTAGVDHYARQILPQGTLGTLHTDLGDGPRERLSAKPAYLSLTIPEWLNALRALDRDTEWP